MRLIELRTTYYLGEDQEDFLFANKELFYWQTLTVPKRDFDKQSGKGPIEVNFIMQLNYCQLES